MSLVRRAVLFGGLGTFAFLGATGALIARRASRRWGATEQEVREALPGDADVPDPTMSQTNAVTIDAAPDDVWPWIAQLGTGRGGWYSYDWIENAPRIGAKTVDRVMPEFQQLSEGDLLKPMPFEGETLWRVKRVEPRGLLLLEAHDPQSGDYTWLFLLREADDGATRLIVRTRGGITGPWRVLMPLIEPAAFVLQRKMMLEIKRLAEKLAWERLPATTPKPSEKAEPAPIF